MGKYIKYSACAAPSEDERVPMDDRALHRARLGGLLPDSYELQQHDGSPPSSSRWLAAWRLRTTTARRFPTELVSVACCLTATNHNSMTVPHRARLGGSLPDGYELQQHAVPHRARLGGLLPDGYKLQQHAVPGDASYARSGRAACAHLVGSGQAASHRRKVGWGRVCTLGRSGQAASHRRKVRWGRVCTLGR